MLNEIRFVLYLLNSILPQFFKEKLRISSINITESEKRALYLEWESSFEKVIRNAGISSKKIDAVINSRGISNLLFQSVIKGREFSNKDVAFILAKDNFIGLNPMGIVTLATTFCQQLNTCVEKDRVLRLFFEEECIYNDKKVCEILELDNPEFIGILSDNFKLKSEYYRHFSERMRGATENSTQIIVYFSDEMGANTKSEEYSVKIDVNIFNMCEICPAFFTFDAEYELYTRELRENLNYALIDIDGNVQLSFGNKLFGTSKKIHAYLWEP